MRIGVRKSSENHQSNPAMAMPVQAKFTPLPHALEAQNSPPESTPENQNSEVEKQGFNFAEIPIFAGGADGSLPKVQPKFNLSVQRQEDVVQRKTGMSQSQINHANRIRKARNLPLIAPNLPANQNNNHQHQPIQNPPLVENQQPVEQSADNLPEQDQLIQDPPVAENKPLNQLAVEKPEEYVYNCAGNNWFEVKNQFKQGLLNHPEGITSESKQQPHGMMKLLETRTQIVDKLLSDVKPIAAEHEKKRRAEIWEAKNGKVEEIQEDEKRQQAEKSKQDFIVSAKPLVANAPGSTKPSSDVDVNMSGDGTEFAVSWLNQEFREKYGHGNESGQVYDVNFYGKDFVPGEVLFGNTGLIKSGQLDRESKEDNLYAEDKWRGSGIQDKGLQKQEMEDQTIASLTMMRVNMEHDVATWNEYVKAASKDAEMKAILDQVEERYQFRKKAIQEAGQQLAQEAQAGKKGYQLEALAKFEHEDELKTMAAENSAYENILKQVETARVKYELLKTSGAGAEDIEKAAVNLKKIKTQATMFANASYYSEGAVVTVVTNKQQLGRMYKDKLEYSAGGKKGLKKLELRPQEYYQSFNEQVGFAFHALHKVEAANFYRDIPEPGKYVHRAYSMLRHFYRTIKKQVPFTEEQRRATSDWEGVKQGKKRIEGQEAKGYVGQLGDEEKNPAIDRIFATFGADANLDATAKIELVKARLMELKLTADQEYTTYLKQLFSSPEKQVNENNNVAENNNKNM